VPKHRFGTAFGAATAPDPKSVFIRENPCPLIWLRPSGRVAVLGPWWFGVAMIDIFNSAFRQVFDAAFTPFRNLNSWVGMAALSLLTALLMLLVYRLTSNQQGIRAAKDKIIAHLLEVRLYRSDLSISFRAQGKILWYNLKYLGHSARPMLVMIVPLVLALIQIDQWFGYETLHPGEAAIVKVRLKEGYQPSLEEVSISPSPGLTVETSPLRIDREGEVDWRLRAVEPGNWDLTFVVNNQALTKRIVIGTKSLSRISPARVARNWFDQLANPGEAAIPEASIVKAILIGYPARSMAFFGWNVHWLVVYFVLSILFGSALKSPFKVEL
jgi:hypothetical protein